MDESMKHDIVIGAAKASPGIIATGYTLNEWVALATIGYICLQAVLLTRKHYLMEKKIKNDK